MEPGDNLLARIYQSMNGQSYKAGFYDGYVAALEVIKRLFQAANVEPHVAGFIIKLVMDSQERAWSVYACLPENQGMALKKGPTIGA